MTIEPAKIIVRHHCVYGRHHFYPVNELAIKLLHFVSPTDARKSFTPEQIRTAKELGMTVDILPMSYGEKHEFS